MNPLRSLARTLRNPVTVKRLRRFRRRRRAWCSLWILAALFVVSLASELLCNDRPLLVRFNGRFYSPVFRFYPADTFLDNGKQTRPDYRRLRYRESFRANSANFMLFPPIPYGPQTRIDPESLRQGGDTVTLRFEGIPNVGSIDVDGELRIVRCRAGGVFFGTEDAALPGRCLADDWTLAETFKRAVARRFRNEASEPIQVATDHLIVSRSAVLSLSRFAPRDRPPATVRITLREPGAALPPPFRVWLAADGRVDRGGAAWQRLPPDIQAALRSGAMHRFTEPVPAREVVVEGHEMRVAFEREDIHWPYAPVRRHRLGIDGAGRDVLARLVYGLRTSLLFGLLLVAVAMVLGITVGAVQGYYGGAVDITGQRLIEIWSSLPFLYIMILMGSVYGRSFALLLFCYGIFNWIGLSRYVRGEFLRLRNLPFVDAARCMGIAPHRIILRHIVPNSLTPVITFFPFSLVGAIGALTALDYLGFGLPPPTPSWGELLHQAQQYRWAWWLILYPSLSLFVVMLLGVFIGEGVRDAFDPKPYSRME